MNPRILLAIYLCVTLLPLMLSWTRIRSPRPILDELAAGAGMLAFAVILVEFVLSGRFRTVSREIGMDVTMRFHQLVARTAVVLAFIHPFLYRIQLNPNYPKSPTGQFGLTTDFASVGTGILAWLLLPVFVALAISRTHSAYSYETWRLTHGAGALLIAALVLHHTLSAGRYSNDPVLKGFWIVLFLTALLSLIYVYLIEPLRQKRRPWRVLSVSPVALKTWEIAIEPDGHDGLAYEAGQFVWLNVGNSAFSAHENPFSISSAPSSGRDLQFTIKELGDFTKTIGNIQSGCQAYIDGPHGNLRLSGRTEPGIALIAGGIGVAPLLGILRELNLTGDKRPTTLIYANRVEDQIVHREELNTLAREHGTKVVHVLSEPPKRLSSEIGSGDASPGEIRHWDTGLVDADLLARLFAAPETRNWLFMLCGPPEMMENIETALINMGIAPGQILCERFTYD